MQSKFKINNKQAIYEHRKNTYNLKDWYLYKHIKHDFNNAEPLISKDWLAILCMSTNQRFLLPHAFRGTVFWLNSLHVTVYKNTYSLWTCTMIPVVVNHKLLDLTFEEMMRYAQFSDLINNQMNPQHRKLLRGSALYCGVARFGCFPESLQANTTTVPANYERTVSCHITSKALFTVLPFDAIKSELVTVSIIKS
jgi:hypothetical protein